VGAVDDVVGRLAAVGTRAERVAAVPDEGRGATEALPVVAPKRTIYDASGSETLPGTVVREENDPPSADIAVNEAYDGLGATSTSSTTSSTGIRSTTRA
jgi:hypothetical protein